MKKGISGSVVGFLVFFLALGVVFLDRNIYIFASVIPIIFTIGFVFIVSKVVKHTKNIENKIESHYDNSNFSTTECKNCHSIIEKASNYCPVCGESQDSTIKCEYCGHINPSSNALCEKCNGFL